MICVVDDDTSVLRSVRELLASDGLEAQTFKRGRLSRLCPRTRCETGGIGRVDAGADWNSTAGALYDLSPKTIVIIISGGEEPVNRGLALDGGAYAFLAKPFDDEEFLASVRDALGEKM